MAFRYVLQVGNRVMLYFFILKIIKCYERNIVQYEYIPSTHSLSGRQWAVAAVKANMMNTSHQLLCR